MNRYLLWKHITSARAHVSEIQRECGPRADPLITREINKMNLNITFAPGLSTRNILYSMRPGLGCRSYDLLRNYEIDVYKIRYMPRHWLGFRQLPDKYKHLSVLSRERNLVIGFKFVEHYNYPYFHYNIFTSSIFYLRSFARILAKRIRIFKKSFNKSMTKIGSYDIPANIRGLYNSDMYNVLDTASYFIKQTHVRILPNTWEMVCRNYPRQYINDNCDARSIYKTYLSRGKIWCANKHAYYLQRLSQYIQKLCAGSNPTLLRDFIYYVKLFDVYKVSTIIRTAKKTKARL